MTIRVLRPALSHLRPVIVSHTTPDDVSAGGVYTFVRSRREAAVGLADGRDVDLFSASIGGQLLRADLVDELRIHLAPVLLGADTCLYDLQLRGLGAVSGNLPLLVPLAGS